MVCHGMVYDMVWYVLSHIATIETQHDSLENAHSLNIRSTQYALKLMDKLIFMNFVKMEISRKFCLAGDQNIDTAFSH